MLMQIDSPGIVPILDMEKFELHAMVSDVDNSNPVYSLVEQMGFTKVDISGKHERLCKGDLFSIYSDDGLCMDSAFAKFKLFMTQNEEIPLLLEEEIVAHQDTTTRIGPNYRHNFINEAPLFTKS